MNLNKAIQHKINNKTKPLGSLGKLEEIALKVALLQNTLSPKINVPTLVVFAADHGIVAEGVSPYPQEVTWQMVMNFISGGAAINVFTKQNGFNIQIVDAGVNYTFEENLAIKNLKIAYGTRNFLHEPAMLTDELFSAFNKADTLVNEIFSSGSNCIAFGEMGIGNTSAAAIIMNKITGIAIEECAGKGTGLSNEGLVHKIMILKKAMLKHQTKSVESILQTFGGFEIAMIYQSILKAAENKMLIIIDGFIVTAALLAAHVTNPSIINFCVFAHQSDENGHKAMLKFLNVEPLLNLQMRLGEGTGAALALPLVQAAVNFLNDMASFESAEVSDKLIN
ncbi:MAG: nicotinate-nucleotide--dimethylbenzimidazole phosphoribosyltransferase [Sphingobacteriales bacterium]|nr:MAG: nicotinate-nucleotide--dimethylbenzimidazole phosphoribosyltransferase [Sphingobacteriales bacterium]